MKHMIPEAIPENCLTVNDYLAEMSENGNWGDGTMLMATSLYYQRQVIIYYPQTEQNCYRLSDNFSDDGAIRLGFVGNNHYVSLVPSSHSSVAGPAYPLVTRQDTDAQLTGTPSASITRACKPLPADLQKVDNPLVFGDVSEVNESSCVMSTSVSDNGGKKDYSWAKFKSEQRGGPDRRRIIVCKVCVLYPDIVRLFSRRIPAITTLTGAVFRQQLADEHAVSSCHAACARRDHQERALADGRVHEGETELEKQFRFANTELEKKVGKLMIQVYMDAKRGTLSAWSFPARYVASLMADRMQLNDAPQLFIPSDADLQYVSPQYHRELLLTIADTDRKSFGKLLQQSLALSLRIDGAVDKQRIDNKHVMANYVTMNGELKTVYVGLSESQTRGSEGLFCALKESTEKCGVKWESILCKTSSIVTDGASENTGQHNSLWSKLSDERKSSNQPNIPLLKIWCGVHRSQLAFKDMNNSVSEVSHVIADCKAVTSFYNVSALRTKEIKKAAIEIGASYKQFPSVNDIRFTEYSYKLLSAILDNHKSMIKHLSSVDTAEAKGLRNKWLDADTVHVAATLSDAVYVYQRFQKLLQGDKISIFDVDVLRDQCVVDLQKLLTRCLPGGYEEKMQVCADATDKSTSFDGLLLNNSARRPTKRQHLFVTTRGRDVKAIKNEIITSLCNFLTARLGTDKEAGLLSYSSEYKALSPNYMQGNCFQDVDIERVYTGLLRDVNKKDFVSAYGELTAVLRSSPDSSPKTLQVHDLF